MATAPGVVAKKAASSSYEPKVCAGVIPSGTLLESATGVTAICSGAPASSQSVVCPLKRPGRSVCPTPKSGNRVELTSAMPAGKFATCCFALEDNGVDAIGASFDSTGMVDCAPCAASDDWVEPGALAVVVGTASPSPDSSDAAAYAPVPSTATAPIAPATATRRSMRRSQV